jgi:hypothetical protein
VTSGAAEWIGLYWSKRGAVACAVHAPVRDDPRWRQEGWTTHGLWERRLPINASAVTEHPSITVAARSTKDDVASLGDLMLRLLDDRAKLEYAILSALEQRIPGQGCERVVVVGHAEAVVDDVVRDLVDSGLADAVWLDGEPGHYLPAGLTEYGRARLSVLRQ